MYADRSIAYFTMEIALDEGMPTYSGGLGGLAGDTVRSAADLNLPLVAVTLLYRKGYFYQQLDGIGLQSEQPVEWVVEDFLEEIPARASVLIEGRTVTLRAWKYEVVGVGGFKVPVFFLDTDIPENTDEDRTLTHFLYGGDQRYRLSQEIILGIGGLRMLRATGIEKLRRFHMNEGHSALMALELLREETMRQDKTTISAEDVLKVRSQCIFTTHTPVPSGQDHFPMSLVDAVLEHSGRFRELSQLFPQSAARQALADKTEFGSQVQHLVELDETLNLTYLALNLSGYINGVAKRHQEISQLMFADYAVDAITNGIHAATWVAPSFRTLFDQCIPGWREDNFSLRYALGVPSIDVWNAHLAAKTRLVQYVNREANAGLDQETLTIGFARRATAYKRAGLLFTDIERLKRMVEVTGHLQVVYSGKAHPKDFEGKKLIQRIFECKEKLRGYIKIAYLENYDLELARKMTAGVDVWLNTPEPPNEASGTSGMKAAVNGVPSLSVLDGWWIEGCIEGVTGWSIGRKSARDDKKAAESLYKKLEVIIPLFYQERERFVEVMRHAIALNGSFFNTQRMLQQYVLKAYYRDFEQ